MNCSLLTPVRALPILTAGCNTSNIVVGHEPILVLNNDPDTYWKPSIRTGISLYIDLGLSTVVDAVALWLQSYNEDWADSKQWEVSFSNDDITYTSSTTFNFADQRTSQKEPVIVGMLASPVNARYWQVEFLNFQNAPSMLPHISCLWFLNDYSLKRNYQLSEKINYNYLSLGVRSQSGQQLSPRFTNFGFQRTFDRTFIFTDIVEWGKLQDAYAAVCGYNLPIFIQLEGIAGAYLAGFFISNLQTAYQEYHYWQPTVSIIEMGFKRVPTDAEGFTDYGEWGIKC